MKIDPFALFSLIAVTGLVLRAEPATTLQAPSDPMAEALPILQTSRVDLHALNYKAGDKLEEVVARSDGQLSLGAGNTADLTPIITATLPNGVAYWRLRSFKPKKDWPELASELKDALTKNPDSGAVLDLRSSEAPDDMRGASQLMAFFAPGDNILSRYNLKNLDGTNALVPANVDPAVPYHGPLIVLTDEKTTGAAEVLAACLKADGALVIGAVTAGKGAAFDEIKLSSGTVLRFVSDRVHLADGTDLWDHPVVPDITLNMTDRSEKTALKLIKDDHVLDVISESPARHRMSEASLVQGQDPEWDDYLSSLEDKPFLLQLPTVHDAALISALDSLKAIRLSQRPPVQARADAPEPISTSVQ